ncbi:MAG: hypothetical protein WAL84_06875 [Candidatus Dormiibacterota bacterium]
MRRVEKLFLVLLVLAGLGSSVVASASAERPNILFLPGGNFPIKFKSLPVEPNTIPWELQSAAGAFKGEGVLLNGEYTSAEGGKFDFLLLHFAKGTTKCTGEGEKAEGEVLAEGTFKSVHDETANKGDAILLEPKLVLILCGISKMHIEGTLLMLVDVKLNEDVVLVLGLLHCGTPTGEPADTKYWEAGVEEKHPLLLVNFGTGFKKACLEVVTNAEKNGMLDIDLEPMVEFMS